MDKFDTEIKNNFQSSLNPHDAHVQAWTGQLDAMHPLALIDRIRQAELDSFGNAWDYWQEVDKDTSTSLNDQAPAQTTATPAPVVAVESASDGPAKRSNRKPSWATVAMPYMKDLFAAGDYKSATVFYKALMRLAGQPDSPFKVVNRELYCTEAGTTVSNGSLGNAWPGIRAQ